MYNEGEESGNNMARILSLGAGLVGSYICDELGKSGHSVTAVALNHDSIPILDTVRGSLSFEIQDTDVFEFLETVSHEDYDLILNLLPGRIGDSIREQLIQSGSAICDLAFSENSPERFAKLAVATGASMIHDCGIAPGVSNMVATTEQVGSEPLKSIRIRVGGNPVQKDENWSYCAPFSPTDVIEEYTRPAIIRVNGKAQSLPAMTGKHLLLTSNHGEMEAFLTDGLRSLLTNPNLTAENMSEYTIRWPGHISKYQELMDGGELDEEKLVEEWAWSLEREEFTYLDITSTTSSDEISHWEIDIPGINIGEGRFWPSMAYATGIPFIVACEALLTGDIEGVQSPDEYIKDLDEIFKRLKQIGASINHYDHDPTIIV